MYGAIYGDLIGSLYEYREYLMHNKELMLEASKKEKLLTPDCFYSDDTILTIAIAEAVKKDLEFEDTLRRYVLENSRPVNRENYFKYMFSPNMINWARGENEGFSQGNGAMMRVSPVPFIGKSFMKVTYDTIEATSPTHNHPEAIKAATCISNLIFSAKNGASRGYLQKMVDDIFMYDYNLDLDKIRDNMTFNTTCSDTIPLVLYVIFNTYSFDEAMRLMLSIGGDTDTNCCIVGSVAEAMYGMSKELKLEIESYLPDEYVKILRYPTK